MRLWSAPQNYGVIPRLLHWLTVDLVILAWVLGTFGDELSRGSARSAGLFLHISAGLAVLALLVFRLVWRVIDRPAAPDVKRLGGARARKMHLPRDRLYGRNELWTVNLKLSVISLISLR